MNNNDLIHKIGIAIGIGIASIAFAQLSDVHKIANGNILVWGRVENIVSQQQENNPGNNQENNSQPSSQPQTPVTNDSQFQESIKRVSEAIARMPQDVGLAIPIISTNRQVDMSYMEMVGFINPEGKVRYITPQDISAMLEDRVKNMEVADISARLNQDNDLENSGVPVLTLIVHNRRTGKRAILKRVNADVFFRDAFYAFLKGTVRQIQ